VEFAKKYAALIALAVILIGGITAGLTLGDSNTEPKSKVQVTSACGSYRSDAAVRVNGQTIKTEVVKTSAELQQGLGGRPCILADQGMLFKFSKPGQLWIWMKDMKFPIDIIWIAPNHQTVGVERNVLPSTYPDKFVNKDKPAQYVLELKADRSSELGIDLGTPINF